MDKRAAVVLGVIFGGLFLVLFGFMLLAYSAVKGAAAAPPPALGQAGLELSVRTTDIAEAASWVRGVVRTGPRELRCTGDDPLATYRSFCAAILLTRVIAETV